MRYIVHLDLAVDARDIGRAAGWVQKHVAECFAPDGFAMIGGNISRAREDKPVEQIVLGSSEAYTNRAAKADLTGLEVTPTTEDALAELGFAWTKGNASHARSGAAA